jgi:hypothetical protein
MIQPYGTLANNSASNESALLINIYRSTDGNSWSYWDRASSWERTAGQYIHLSPLVKYAVVNCDSSYHYRFDLWFHLRGFSNDSAQLNAGYGVGEGAISLFRVNRAGDMD